MLEQPDRTPEPKSYFFMPLQRETVSVLRGCHAGADHV
jgi:hypothetical protein